MDFKEHLLKYLPSDFVDELLISLEKPRTNSLILNTNKIKEEEFINMFPNIQKNENLYNSYSYDKNIYPFGKSYLFDNGAYYIIDKSSQLTTSFLEVNDNDLILDLCAAPGGKTISLALKYPNANIISNDLSLQRALTLSSNIEKLGLSNVYVINNDFSKIYKNFPETFDSIILDAPCSGSAMFRKSIEMKNDWNYKKVLAFSKIQQELFEIAFFMLKPGGFLVYSTCSFSYEEDDENILNFLKKHKNCKVFALKDNKTFYHTQELKEGIHLFPNLFDGEGQFICYLKKDGNITNNLTKNNLKTTFKSYPINLNYIEENKGIYYGYNLNFNFKNMHLIRKGLLIGEESKGIFKPSFHLAHYLSCTNTISLNEEEFKKYIHGDEISKNLNLKNDYYIVSYKNLNLGFIKYTNGKLKNLYPKGLRH